MRNIRVCCLLLAFALLFVGCAKEEGEVVRVDLAQADGELILGGIPEGAQRLSEGNMPEGGIMIPEGGLQEGAAPLGDESMLQDEKQSPNDIGTIGGQDEGNAIYGKVDSIAGNQVILILGTYNEDGTLAYGNETATYLLPVGMAIGTGNFTSVTKGMVLRITLETLEDGSENITSVSIVSR